MMRLQLMLMSAKLKIVRLQFRNGAIWALIALFLANQIAPIVHDFKMNIINKITALLLANCSCNGHLYIEMSNTLLFRFIRYLDK